MFKVRTEYNSQSGFIFCCGCGQLLAAVKMLQSFKFAFVCKCGELHTEKYKYKATNRSVANAVLHKDDRYFCSSCGEEIFRINSHSISGFAFTARCACGNICTNNNVIESIDRSVM